MTPEVLVLLQRAQRSIRSAKLLLADGDYDSAVSGAYYAMFYLTEALLLSKGLAFSKHSGVIAAFGREFAKTGVLPAEIHRQLIDAFEARNIADYQHASLVTVEATTLHFSHAESFLSAAADYLKAQLKNEE